MEPWLAVTHVKQQRAEAEVAACLDKQTESMEETECSDLSIWTGREQDKKVLH